MAGAVEFARSRFISRSTGGNAVRSAAYNERTRIRDEREPEAFDFRHSTGHLYHDILLPDGASLRLKDTAYLWNLAERSERRKDSQVAREILIALPSNRHITHADRIELARSFAHKFVAAGLAVQIDIHEPHPPKKGVAPDLESEQANYHAHLLLTTRRVDGDYLAAKKATDLMPQMKTGARTQPFVAERDDLGKAWRDHQNAYFAEHGIDLEVDSPAIHTAKHVGPVRFRGAAKSRIDEEAAELKQQNVLAARDPAKVLAAMVRGNATFTERDVDQFLHKHMPEPLQRPVVKQAVLALAIPLREPGTGADAGRFTATSVRNLEKRVLAEANGVAKSHHYGIVSRSPERVLGLYPDQLVAFRYASEARGLAVITGRSGTGKSHVLTALREAFSDSGYQVRGLGPTNQVAEQLRGQGFPGARTVHAELFALANRRTQWHRRTAVVIDEAAMLSTPIMAEVMAYANKAGARVVLAGDDRQFGAVAAPGGMFRELANRHGSVEVTKVIRQHVDWQRQASEDLSIGRYSEALQAYQDHHAIHWTMKHEHAKNSLVTHWAADSLAAPADRRFVLAYTNADVDELNAKLRQARIDRSEIAAGTPFTTKYGRVDFSVGDRVQFTQTYRTAAISNGNIGTISRIEGGRLWADLDGGRKVDWVALDFDAFRHGYAGTIYKGQGKTLDRAYVLHTWHMSAQASYVALTRHTKEVSLYVSRGVASNMAALVRQMARTEEKGSSLQWATDAEIGQRSEIMATIKQQLVSEAGESVAKPQGKSAIAQAVEHYDAGRPRSDLEVWAREIAHGNLDFEDVLEAMVSVDLERDRTSGASFTQLEARLGHKLLDAVNKFERLKAGVEPAPKVEWDMPKAVKSIEPLLESSRQFAGRAIAPDRDPGRDVAD